MKLQIALIVNKHSGRHFKIKKYRKLKLLLETLGIVQEFEIRDPIDLKVKSAQIANEFDLLVIWGGDGTVHGLLNLLKSSMPPVLILPVGSGNDISKICHPNLSFARIEGAIKNLHFDVMDLIEIKNSDTKYCATVACLGTDARVSKRADMLPRFLAGARYVIASILEIFMNAPNPISLKSSTFNYQGEVSVCSLANTPHYGGGIHISPLSKTSDARLELVFVPALKRWKLLLLFILLLFKMHNRSKEIKFLSTNEIQVEPISEKVEIWADGQFICLLPATIKIADFKLKYLRV